MRKRPPRRKLTKEEERQADVFVGDAGKRASEEGGEGKTRKTEDSSKEEEKVKRAREDPVYPWEEGHVRTDVKQGYALRLPEPLYLKLKYISSQTGESMNQLVNDAVSEMVHRKLPPLT